MDMKATRDAYGHALVELGGENPRLVVLDADLSRSTRTEWFQQKFPDRFFNLGIAEQNMVGVAAGLAASGLLPFATTYAIFVGRAYDQIREAVCYARTNVKIVATHAGLAASYDGGAHQGIEDITLMRVIPGMTVLSPADYNETVQAIRAAAAFEGPVYIRLQKEPVPVVTPATQPFVIGRATILEPGEDVAIVATGSLTSRALAAATLLRHEGLAAEVINASTLKPFDVATIRRSIARCGCAVTVEEHNRYGGLYEAVLAALSGEVLAPVVPVAMPDVFGETGPWVALLEKFGLTEGGICGAARIAVGKKRRPGAGAHLTDRDPAWARHSLPEPRPQGGPARG